MEIELFNDFGEEKFIVKIPLKDFLESLSLAKDTLYDIVFLQNKDPK